MTELRPTRIAASLAVALLLLLAAASPAGAATVWRLTSVHGPQNIPPGSTTAQYVLQAYNVGTTDSSGTVTVTDTLPQGVTGLSFSGADWACTGLSTRTVTCTSTDLVPAPGPAKLARGAAATLSLTVSVGPGVSGTASNIARISGGGASGFVTTNDPTTFSAIPAGFGIVPGSFQQDFFDAAIPGGSAVRQAGAHPFELRLGFNMNLTERSYPGLGTWTEPDEFVKTTQVHLPAGLVGNPQAVPECPSLLLYASSLSGRGACPSNTQVGIADLTLQSGSVITPGSYLSTPIYNMVPPKGAIAAFALVVLTNPVWIVASLDPSDYSVVTTIKNTNDVFQLRVADIRFWGVPADPAHDALRINDTATDDSEMLGKPFTGAPIRSFLTLPSQCGVDGSTQLQVDSWQHPGVFSSAQSAPVQMTGCGDARFHFDPAISVQPTASTPSTPTGLDVDVSVPQKDETVADPTQLYAQSGNDAAIATPPLHDAAVTLPAGMAVSPSSADGLAACSSAQIKLGTNDDPACPDAAKIGSAELTTPLLATPVEGSIYLAAQGDNPFGSLLSLYLVFQDKDRGLIIKLAGKVAPDPVTGQLTTTFADNPQLPFSKLHLHFKDGPRAPLVTPPACGTYTANATLGSWNTSLPAAHPTSSFSIAGGVCARAFDPTFKAGTTTPVAGKDSPLVTRFARGDGDQELGSIDVKLPRGLLGRIAGVPLCADAAANAGACGEGSRIGSTTVAAGAGSNPFYIKDGRVYITGPYKGAPFGLSIVVPAKAGPFDLGNVVVRAAIFVDHDTAALRIVTDPLPTILQGIPLQLRLAQVTVDRPGFTFNPTNCSTLYSTAKIVSAQGTVATKYSRFQVDRCAALGFGPQMSMTIGARNHTAAGTTTPLTTTLRVGKGQANLHTVRVVLPTTLNARLGVVSRACTLEQFHAGHCTSRAKVGTAVAVTPVLKDPLRGSAYFVRNPARPIPDLMVALRGQVSVDLTGKVTIPGSTHLATVFDTIPDVPVTSFTLRLVSGVNGPIGNIVDLCSARGRNARVILGFRAQNGKLIQRAQPMNVKGCPAPNRKR